MRLRVRSGWIGAPGRAFLLLMFACSAVAEAPKQVFFGDLHLHTRLSNDAFSLGTERGPDDAYRYAKGEAIPHIAGQTIRLKTPLDFLAVTDHAEYLGGLLSSTEAGSPLAETELGRKLRSDDISVREQAFLDLVSELRSGNAPEEFTNLAAQRAAWQEIVEAANRHYQPGRFTTFAGYEWTSMVQGGNLHRCVIFEDTEGLPFPFSATDSHRPEDLWSYLETSRARGVDVLAIPHNPNVSDGRMFALLDSYGDDLGESYARRRTRNEPLVEIVQQKGTSETHPLLSPTDEFAGFEIFPELLVAQGKLGKVSGSYAREALGRGLATQERQSFNPFAFGFVGATDNHAATSAVEEDNLTGFSGLISDSTPELRNERDLWGGVPYQAFSAAGLTGVWSEENTRSSVFRALARRETFATSGPQIVVRVFAAWGFPDGMMERDDWAERAARVGVPMGGELSTPEGSGVPELAIYARKDPRSGNLDRLQVIKLWSEGGIPYEQIFDVALSDGRKPDQDGAIPPVGNTVDVESAAYRNSIGDPELATIWKDPAFDPKHPTLYYVRVLEIPTPRWSTYDAAALEIEPREDVPTTLQERAFTSPIWYYPTAKE